MSDEAKSTPDPSACPKCGAAYSGRDTDSDLNLCDRFECGSWIPIEGSSRNKLQQSKQCRIAELERENAELRQMIAEDCCSKLEANQRIANAQAEAAKVYGPVIDDLRQRLEAVERERDALDTLAMWGEVRIGEQIVSREVYGPCIGWSVRGYTYMKPIQAIRAALAALDAKETT